MKKPVFEQLFTYEGVLELDQSFLKFLATNDSQLYEYLLDYRGGNTTNKNSDFLIKLSGFLESFLIDFFKITDDFKKHQTAIQNQACLFSFKKYFISRMAIRKINKELPSDFKKLDELVVEQIRKHVADSVDEELSVAKLGNFYIENKDKFENEIEQLVDWCAHILKDPLLDQSKSSWSIFSLSKSIEHEKLVPHQSDGLRNFASDSVLKFRDGFKLTDSGMSERKVLNQVNNCMFCHNHEGDYCSKGFPKSKGSTEFSINALDNLLIGCPLDIKISEMLFLQKTGNSIAALAVLMKDNPFCPLTGHRICNDCMKSCIYQKQEPVDVPQIETRILKDVLALPWGIEIYDLLTRWNPLLDKSWMMQPYNGKKVLIVGSGPSGLAMAHYLLHNGCAVIIMDGLKLEKIPDQLIYSPIQYYSDIKEDLDKRITWGCGGVAEYGITVRWDKNLLKLVYISLMRRKYFRAYGNVRFGGTITVEQAWEQGFDHLVIAVGAGLPKELPIPGSLSPGMRQANDFLMALHLTGLNKSNGIVTYQIRLPAIVVGGGLTAVDTATEVQAYYVKQVEDILNKYEYLIQQEIRIDQFFSKQELNVIKEFVNHGIEIRKERMRARALNMSPDFVKLIRKWGGVTIAYRRRMQESPAYRRNHEELNNALQEGVFYIENFDPEEAVIDSEGDVEFLRGLNRESSQYVLLPARTIFIATGTKPNIAYEFEHRGTFERDGFEYKAFQYEDKKLYKASKPAHLKEHDIGSFTSYSKKGKCVTFIGDAHPIFHGNVVNAIASATKTYPSVLDLLNIDDKENIAQHQKTFESFIFEIEHRYTQFVVDINRVDKKMTQLTVSAPQAAAMFTPGQFYRLQAFETDPIYINGKSAFPKSIEVFPAFVDKEKGEIVFNLIHNDINKRIFSHMKAGQHISVMGPTGSKIGIPKNEVIVVLGDALSLNVMTTFGQSLKENNNEVIYIACLESADDYFNYQWETVASKLIWCLPKGIDLPVSYGHLFSGNVSSIIHEITNDNSVFNGYQEGELRNFLKQASKIFAIGQDALLQKICSLKENSLKHYFSNEVQYFGFVFGPMQCMLKGICGHCLQWQIDPITKKRTKAVFACSWQCQPLEIIDINHLYDRNKQNRITEKLQEIWFNSSSSLLKTYTSPEVVR